MQKKPIKILLACSGIGRFMRGYEVSFMQLYNRMKDFSDIKMYLAQGVFSNNDPCVICPWYLNLNKEIINIQKLIPFIRRFHIEESSFAIGLLPLIISNKIDIIMYSQLGIGDTLSKIRKIFKLKYKLLYSNGGPSNSGEYQNHCDYVQQKLPWVYDLAKKNGFPEGRMSVVPNGFFLKNNGPASINEKFSLREELSINHESTMLLNVGAINRYHKRTDYVISELKTILNSGKYILYCLGQEEEDTLSIKNEFIDLINNGSLVIKTVDTKEIYKYYKAADLFIMGSLFEGFGRSIVEALSYGLHCILHEHPGFKTLAGQHATYIDMSKKDSLSALSPHLFEFKNNELKSHEAFNFVLEKYDWDNVVDEYKKLFTNTLLINK